MLGMSYCDRPVSIVRRPQFASNNISSVTSGRISTKIDGRSSTKIAQIVLLRCTKWLPELKREKPLKDFLGQWPDFKIISQKCSLGDPLPKQLKWFPSAEQNGRQS